MARVTLEPHCFETGDFGLVSEDYPYFMDDGISLFHLTLDVIVVVVTIILRSQQSTWHGELYCVTHFQEAVLKQY